jgi:hypothetical protein
MSDNLSGVYDAICRARDSIEQEIEVGRARKRKRRLLERLDDQLHDAVLELIEAAPQ